MPIRYTRAERTEVQCSRIARHFLSLRKRSCHSWRGYQLSGFFDTFFSCKDADPWIPSERAGLPLESAIVMFRFIIFLAESASPEGMCNLSIPL